MADLTHVAATISSVPKRTSWVAARRAPPLARPPVVAPAAPVVVVATPIVVPAAPVVVVATVAPSPSALPVAATATLDALISTHEDIAAALKAARPSLAGLGEHFARQVVTSLYENVLETKRKQHLIS